MDSKGHSLTIDKLTSDNYYTWKKKVTFYLALKELSEHLEREGPKTKLP